MNNAVTVACIIAGVISLLILIAAFKTEVHHFINYLFNRISIFHKIITNWWTQIQPKTKKIYIVPGTLLLIWALFFAIFFNNTQRAHREITNAIEDKYIRCYGKQEFEILEFGKLEKCTLQMGYVYGYFNRNYINGGNIPSNIKAKYSECLKSNVKTMDCHYRIKGQNGKWKSFYKTFVFHKNMEIVDCDHVHSKNMGIVDCDYAAIWYCDPEFDNNKEWINYKFKRDVKEKELKRVISMILNAINNDHTLSDDIKPVIYYYVETSHPTFVPEKSRHVKFY